MPHPVLLCRGGIETSASAMDLFIGLLEKQAAINRNLLDDIGITTKSQCRAGMTRLAAGVATTRRTRFLGAECFGLRKILISLYVFV